MTWSGSPGAVSFFFCLKITPAHPVRTRVGAYPGFGPGQMTATSPLDL